MKLDVIYNEDCMGEKGMRILPDKSIDMVLCDLPYGTTACKWDSIIPLEPMWKQLRRVIKLNGAIVTTASQPFTSILVMSNLKMFKHEWIWIKNRGSNFANTVREPMKEHESILVFSNGEWTYNRQMQFRAKSGLARSKYLVEHNDQDRETYRKFEGREKHKITEMRIPSSWQKFNIASGKEKTKHPTQKPVALMEYLIKTYTNEGEIVLDFAMGSGTTAVPCKKLGRHYIGFEINSEYCEIAKKRLSEVQLELLN